MRGILLSVLLLSFPSVGGFTEEPCTEQADFCGPGTVKPAIPGLPADIFPSRGPVFAADTAVSSAPAVPAPSPGKKPSSSAKSGAPAPAPELRAPGAEESGPGIMIFHTYDCPHCRAALRWASSLRREYPGLALEDYEVKLNPRNREFMAAALAERGEIVSGFPTIVVGKRVMVGFSPSRTPGEIKAELDRLYGRPSAGCPAPEDIQVPLLGRIDPASVSLLNFSFTLGLLDGLNPCAMWVLMFLMGLLLYTRSRRRMLFIGSVFVAASGLVYFAFMAAWFNLFLVIGHARWITAGLGLIAVLMGLVNLKELFFFKKGVSLMIADGAKAGLAAKVRGILNQHGGAAMAFSTVLLAVFVNLIELGCTIGLPAVFTRVLALREAGLAEKYWYMAVYNAAYIVPLALIVSVFVCTMGRYRMTESHGKVLKGVSGALLLLLGLLMLLKPEALLL